MKRSRGVDSERKEGGVVVWTRITETSTHDGGGICINLFGKMTQLYMGVLQVEMTLKNFMTFYF